MPVISINFSHNQYNAIVKGALELTKGNLSEYVKKYGVMRDE